MMDFTDNQGFICDKLNHNYKGPNNKTMEDWLSLSSKTPDGEMKRMLLHSWFASRFIRE